MKSYISRKFPLETRTTDQILARRSEELSIGFHLRKGPRYFSSHRQKQAELLKQLVHDESVCTPVWFGVLTSARSPAKQSPPPIPWWRRNLRCPESARFLWLRFQRWLLPRRRLPLAGPGVGASLRLTKSVRWDWRFLFPRCPAQNREPARTSREIPSPGSNSPRARCQLIRQPRARGRKACRQKDLSQQRRRTSQGDGQSARSKYQCETGPCVRLGTQRP